MTSTAATNHNKCFIFLTFYLLTKKMFDVYTVIVSSDAAACRLEAKLALEQHEQLKINIYSQHLPH